MKFKRIVAVRRICYNDTVGRISLEKFKTGK